MRGYCIHWCGAGYAMQEEIVKLQARVAKLTEALWDIEKGDCNPQLVAAGVLENNDE